MMINDKRKKYHPAIPLAFHLSTLPDSIVSMIPKSTRHDWKYRDMEALFGSQFCSQEKEAFTVLSMIAKNKHLLAVNKALVRLVALSAYIRSNCESFKRMRQSYVKVFLGNFEKVVKVVGLKSSLRLAGLSYSRYLKFKNSVTCKLSPINLCRRKHPAQLLKSEARNIIAICEEENHKAWPLSSVFYQGIRNKTISCSLPTFYKYAAILVNGNPLPCHRRKNHTIGIKADRPLKITHADITQFTTADHTKAYIYLIQDNFSRCILAGKICTERKAVHMLELIKKVYNENLKQFPLATTTLVTDDGCENKGISQLFETQSDLALTHLIAQKDIIFSNSMIEHFNKTLKYRYLYQQPIYSIESLETHVVSAISNYNNRPARVLLGLTPLESLSGQKSDQENLRIQIRKAAIERIAKNKATDCCLSF